MPISTNYRSNATIIFAGPSISVKEIHAIYPECFIHGPAKCGDILKVLRLKPKKILILDGYYESVASNWHKEILYAMECGVKVYGAASMGAIRAAELNHYGMIGIGEIYQAYKSCELTDDDEVALIHGPRSQNYIPFSQAMVDIRATLKHAQQASIIDEEMYQILIDAVKHLFYQQRSIEAACESIKQKHDQYDFTKLLAWLKAGNSIDLKKQDAIAAIKFVAADTTATVKSSTPKISWFRKLLVSANASCFEVDYAWLPKQEQRLVRFKRELPKAYSVLHELALLLGVTRELAVTDYRNMAKPDLKFIDRIKQNFKSSLGEIMDLMLPTSFTSGKQLQRRFSYVPSQMINITKLFAMFADDTWLSCVYYFLVDNVFELQLERGQVKALLPLFAYDLGVSGYSSETSEGKLISQLLTMYVTVSLCLNRYLEQHTDLAPQTDTTLVDFYKYTLLSVNLNYDKLAQVARLHGFAGERWQQALHLIVRQRLIFKNYQHDFLLNVFYADCYNLIGRVFELIKSDVKI